MLHTETNNNNKQETANNDTINATSLTPKTADSNPNQTAEPNNIIHSSSLSSPSSLIINEESPSSLSSASSPQSSTSHSSASSNSGRSSSSRSNSPDSSSKKSTNSDGKPPSCPLKLTQFHYAKLNSKYLYKTHITRKKSLHQSQLSQPPAPVLLTIHA